MSLRPLSLAVAILLAAGCAADTAPAPTPAADTAPARDDDREPDETAEVDPLIRDATVDYATVAETFVTQATPDDNIDSPAAWAAPDGKVLLFATAKEGKGLVMYDGDTGATLRDVGTEGDRPGQFKRPNGVSVLGDRLYVVERDNQRVQVLALPSLETITSFGQAELEKPYGLWVRELADGQVEVLVTDAYMAGEDANGDEIPPPLAELDRRVQRYRLRFGADAVAVTPVGGFGDTGAEGAIRVPESLWGDEAHQRLLISEEDLATGTSVREYGLDGKYRGRTLGLDRFKAQAEGLALWACPDGSGYWLATDQYKDRSLFHVYDRETLEPLGAFAGNTVANTDGVWLHQEATAGFPKGVFYAVHDDMAVGAFDWRGIATALGLRQDCAAP